MMEMRATKWMGTVGGKHQRLGTHKNSVQCVEPAQNNEFWLYQHGDAFISLIGVKIIRQIRYFSIFYSSSDSRI